MIFGFKSMNLARKIEAASRVKGQEEEATWPTVQKANPQTQQKQEDKLYSGCGGKSEKKNQY